MIDRKVVIRLAREAGYDEAESHSGRLRTFALLIMAEACNRVVDDIPHSEIIKAAIEDEREACAKKLDEMAAEDKLTNYFKVAALAIRERGAP